MPKRRILLLIFFIALISKMHSQDVHWSQQQFSTLQQSPAMLGAFKGTLRSTGMYRNQWRTVPVDFRTFSAAVEKKLPTVRGFKTAAAFRLLRDDAGDAGLNWTQADLLASAFKPLSEIWTASIGIGLTLGQRSFDINKLSFKNQWNGDIYDTSLPSGESFGTTSGLIPAFQAGAALHYAEPGGDGRTEAHFFVGSYNLNAPTVSFENLNDSRLAQRITFGGWAVIKLFEKSDFVLGSFFQIQDTYFQGLVHTGYRYHLGINGKNPTFVEFGGAFRIGDAVIPSIRLDWNAWSIGASYDINISSFDVATRSRGGFEVGLMHRIIPVEPVSIKKACPIF